MPLRAAAGRRRINVLRAPSSAIAAAVPNVRAPVTVTVFRHEPLEKSAA
jgi:hypothetical protein